MNSVVQSSLRLAAPILAVLAAWAFDRMSERRGLTPPRFRLPAPVTGIPGGDLPPVRNPGMTAPIVRRAVADGLLASVFWLGVFAPLAELGSKAPIDISKLSAPRLFLLHAVLVVMMAAWYFLGFGARRSPRGGRWLRQFGLSTDRLGEELGLGVMAGIGAWAVVLLALVVIAGLILALGGRKILPQQPPSLIYWIAGLPLVVRLAASVSAGLVEETFFRGFLQPRIGIALSTAFFVLAHASYGEPFMFVGITLLSLLYAFLVKWRRNIWPAIVAHAIFDGVQLTVVIPFALRYVGQHGRELKMVAMTTIHLLGC
ncbi:MAG TPA: CPBP family intramembrane glutamic endopeptidase [Thermoanaerobaculia bacterium]|nr:CPBP family intramembrane glutamic endopeptidase [Thermoanaerobaculia bacterium]